MSTSSDHRALHDQLLATNHLTADTRLYREALYSTLRPTETPGLFHLAPNAIPSESVIDVYGAIHLVQAQSAGAGLAFAETARPNWLETMEVRTLRADASSGALPDPHVEVEVRLGDLLDQGAMVYPVESVTVERAWYCTMPEGAVLVRIV